MSSRLVGVHRGDGRPLLWTIRKFRSVHSAAQVHSHYSITVLLTLLNTTNSTLYHSLTALRKDLVRLWKPSQPKGPDRNHRRKLQLVSAKLKWRQHDALPFWPKCRHNKRASSRSTQNCSKKQVHPYKFFPFPGLNRIYSFVIFAVFQRVVALP